MNNLELCHLGENCAPGIIIDDLLKSKNKGLFMLGFYLFNSILHYLNDNNYEEIYNKEHFVITQDNLVHHKKYNFVFNHDYNIESSQITNYDFVKQRFDTKIKNFKEMLLTDKCCIFITFSENVDSLKINDMLNWLSNNKRNFYLIIFTNNSYNTIFHPNLCINRLENTYNEWWVMERQRKIILYKEIYETFIHNLKMANITHDFPITFEQTNYDF